MRALHTAATGMMAQELNVQVISNNIANMRTTGYKRQRAEFQDLLYEHVRRVGTQTSDQGNMLPAGIELGSGVKTVGTPRLMTQGGLAADRQGLRRRHPRRRLLQDRACRTAAPPIRATARSNSTRKAASSPPHGNRRAARHHHSAERDLGHHQRAGPGLGAPCPARPRRPQVGQIELAIFINKAGLQAIGDNLYLETPASGTPQNGTPAATASATCSRAISNRPTSRR